MKRCASQEEPKTLDIPFKLSPLQEEKLLNFFKYYLDGDCDGFVFEHDFHQLAEVLINNFIFIFILLIFCFFTIISINMEIILFLITLI